MVNSASITITFVHKGKKETRTIDKMHIDSYHIKDFYRIPGKRINFDIYKKDGVWLNAPPLRVGLSAYLLKLIGNAIDEAEATNALG